MINVIINAVYQGAPLFTVRLDAIIFTDVLLLKCIPVTRIFYKKLRIWPVLRVS